LGYYLNEIKKALTALGKTRSDIPKLTGDKYSPGNVSALFRGTIPESVKTIALLAKHLKADEKKLRIAAAQDKIGALLDKYDVAWEDLCKKGAGQAIFKIPVYMQNELPSILSPTGQPTKHTDRSHFVAVDDYGPHAYGLIIEDGSISPNAQQGELVILSPEYRLGSMDEYGVVGTGKHIYLGRIQDKVTKIQIECLKPYNIHVMPKKSVKFIHKIVGKHTPKYSDSSSFTDT